MSDSFPSDDRKLLVGLLGVLVAVFALVASNVAANHSPKPHRHPIGIVGTPAAGAAVRAELTRAAPGAFKVHAYLSLVSARTAVLHRSVYGAFQPAPAPSLLVATRASPPVAVLLQRTFARVAGRSGRALAVADRSAAAVAVGNPRVGSAESRTTQVGMAVDQLAAQRFVDASSTPGSPTTPRPRTAAPPGPNPRSSPVR